MTVDFLLLPLIVTAAAVAQQLDRAHIRSATPCKAVALDLGITESRYSHWRRAVLAPLIARLAATPPAFRRELLAELAVAWDQEPVLTARDVLALITPHMASVRAARQEDSCAS